MLIYSTLDEKWAMYRAGGLTSIHRNMLMLDLSKYKCYRMKYRLHMGNAHMACDPKGGLP